MTPLPEADRKRSDPWKKRYWRVGISPANTTREEPKLMSNASPAEKEERLTLLRFLSASLEAGWKRKRVAGWVFTDEIPGDHGRELEPLAKSGHLLREDVRDPARRVPLYLSRITQPGEDEVAAAEQRAPRVVDTPRAVTLQDRETIWMPLESWQALQALIRRQLDQPWLSIAELGDAARTPLYPANLEFLMLRGLADEDRPAVVDRASPIRYAATALGRCAKLRATGTTRAQIRIRGMRSGGTAR